MLSLNSRKRAEAPLLFYKVRKAHPHHEQRLILQVFSSFLNAAGMPQYTIRSGGKIVIVNNQPTPLDRMAGMHFDDLGSVFEELNKLLTG